MSSYISRKLAVIKGQITTLSQPIPAVKFNTALPHPQAAIDIFKGRWACQPIVHGAVPQVYEDPRPIHALRAFGPDVHDLAGKRVLELGPNDGVHTSQLEKQLGAEVVAVDANAEAYLKMLVAKEIFGLRARVLFGDFMEYLSTVKRGDYDLIFASGVLYHMEDPLELIRRICAASDRCFMMTHYYGDPIRKRHVRIEKDNGYGPVPHFRRAYRNKGFARFWGGIGSHQCWLERDDILRAFREYGHRHIEVLADDPHPLGPTLSFVTSAKPL